MKKRLKAMMMSVRKRLVGMLGGVIEEDYDREHILSLYYGKYRVLNRLKNYTEAHYGEDWREDLYAMISDMYYETSETIDIYEDPELYIRHDDGE